MNKFSWDDISLFLAVVELGSFARASLKLNMAQPSVGRRIDQFEERLGAKLFERKSTGVELTSAGRAILPAAENMARSANKLEQAANVQQSAIEGAVRIAVPDGLATFWLAPAIAKFQTENPKLRVTLDCGLWQKETGDLSADYAIMYEEPKDQDTVRIPLCWVHYSYFAARNYVDTYGMPKTLAELLSHRSIRHFGQTQQKVNWSNQTTAIETLANCDVTTNSSAACLMALRSGAGILAAPTAVCEMFPELVALPFGQVVKLRLYLYYRRETANVARMKATREWLIDLFDSRNNIWFREDFNDPYEYMQKHEKHSLNSSSVA
ncbi:MAG: LysR family transcriptional regulator [Hyphomonadaceae bacterium]